MQRTPCRLPVVLSLGLCGSLTACSDDAASADDASDSETSPADPDGGTDDGVSDPDDDDDGGDDADDGDDDGSDDGGSDDGGSDDGGGDTGDDGDTGEPAGEDEPYSVDAFGYADPRPDRFQPLTRGRFRMVGSDELALLIPQELGAAGRVVDDRVQGDGMSPALGLLLDEVPAGEIWQSAKGELDAIAGDEMILAGLDGGLARIGVLGREGSALVSLQEIELSAPAGRFWSLDVVTADVDADGRDEAIVSGLYGGGVPGAEQIDGAQLVVIDDAVAGYGILHTGEFVGVDELRVAGAQLDLDDADELVVLHRSDATTANLDTLDDAAAGFAATGTAIAFAVVDRNPDAPSSLLRLAVAAGDLDHDGVDEPVLGAIWSDQGAEQMLIRATPTIAGQDQLVEASVALEQSTWPLTTTDWPWTLAVADTNGDGFAEAVSLVRDRNDDRVGCQLDHFSLGEAAAPVGFGGVHHGLEVGSQDLEPQGRCDMTVLDDDRDGKDAIAVATIDRGDGNEPRTAEVERFVSVGEGNGQGETWSRLTQDGGFVHVFPAWVGPDEPIAPVLLGADFDGDSLELRYTGNKWLSLPKPQIVAVASAPPAEAGISQVYAATGTAYGTEVSSGSGQAVELGVSTGVTASFELASVIPMLSWDVSASWRREVDTTIGTTETTTYGKSFAGGWDRDQVIFQGTLYRVYEYEITSAPDPTVIGSRMTIDEPVDTKTYSWSLPYFNATVAPAYRLPADLLKHVPGDVSSYMQTTDRDLLVNTAAPGTAFVSELQSCGQGGSANGVSIALAESADWETAVRITSEYGGGTSVAGLGFEASYGLTDGSVYSVSVGNAVEYLGTVGHIETAADYESYHYGFGMVVAPKTVAGATFQVIDYWVQDLGPAH